MKRLAGQLQDQPDFLERKTKFTIVLPLVRTYIYNPDYVTQSEVINAAIECLGAVAASHSFKDYRSMLIGKIIYTVKIHYSRLHYSRKIHYSRQFVVDR